MGSFILAAAVAVVIFIVALALMPRAISSASETRTRAMLDSISAGAREVEVLPGMPSPGGDSPMGKLLLAIPGVRGLYLLMLKAGYAQKIPAAALTIAFAAVLLSSLASMTRFGGIGAILAIALTYMAARKFFRYKIDKRNKAFINDFPDAIDMIVRSVRSGHPVNTSFRMIVDNMGPPVSTEFRQVLDEVAYGRTMTEALQRLAQRVDEADLHFFVVVLSVQQETGGNLAEVLSNLSGIIRKRRQLHKKIRALTSEGRMTGWILGGLPLFEFLVLYFMQPEYLTPLFTTFPGNVILAAAISLVALALWITRQMINIDI